MHTQHRPWGPLTLVLVIAALLVQGLAPALAAAAELSPQTEAVIANADGDRVRLRSGPGSGTDVRALLSEGTAVFIDAGPETADDGSAWYLVVTRDGGTGYVAAEFVSVGQNQPPPEILVASTTETVNLRAGPSLADAILQSLEAGTKVTISGESIDGWFAVSIEQTMGFIHGDFLSEGTPEVDAKAGSGTRYVLEAVRLRTGPGTGYRIMDTLPVGLRLDFTGQIDGSFAKVSSNRGTGWVAARYIGPVAPGGTGSSAEGTRYTTDSVRLRSGPGTGYRILANLPSGATLTLTGAQENGFAKVSTSRGTGWVSTQYVGGSASSGGTRAYTNDSVSLRSGPGSGYRRLASLSTGATLTLTGETSGSYSKARSNAGTGWVATAYISSVAPQYTGGTRYTIDSVNLRRGPGSSYGAIRVVPSGTEIRFTGTVVNNYGKVATGYGDGWISIDYFRKSRPTSGGSSTGRGSSLVVWPVKGGEWYVSQGYNGSSHQNQSRYWQYYYAFDLKRSSGSTAWQPVYAPVDGRIRWIDESTGGMSIYMGDGLAFAMFHVLWANSIREGQSITQGQYLGVIAPAGVANSGSSAHIHITAWTTADEGNWSRHAQPFTGRFAIEGTSFPSTGKRNDYLSYSFNP